MTDDGGMAKVVGRIGIEKPAGLSPDESDAWDSVVSARVFTGDEAGAVLEYVQTVAEWQSLSRRMRKSQRQRFAINADSELVESVESIRERELADRMIAMSKSLGLVLSPEERAAHREAWAARAEAEPAEVIDITAKNHTDD